MALDEAALQPTVGAIDALDDGDSGPLYCYRHPRSETYVRCGRCDQPICPKCAVQGPVGFRCRQCGLVKNATLSSFTPQQLALGIGASFGGGAVLGFLGGQVGFYSIFIAFAALQVAMFMSTYIPEGAELPIELWLQSMLPYIAIGAGAALAGAYSRVRWF